VISRGTLERVLAEGLQRRAEVLRILKALPGDSNLLERLKLLTEVIEKAEERLLDDAWEKVAQH